MSRITDKDLQRALNALNDAMGYKGYKWNERTKKYTGKGFIIEGAYGGNKLAFIDASKGTGTYDVTYGYVSKRELFETMSDMKKGVYWYKNRNKK